MDKPKHELAQPEKKKAPTAQVEFVAPYRIQDCRLRILDTKSLGTGFFEPSIRPSCEKTVSGVACFKIRRTWNDSRFQEGTLTVELNGRLERIDETSTVVIASTRVSPVPMLMTVLLTSPLWLCGILLPFKFGIVFLVCAGVILLSYLLIVWSDRGILLGLIHRAMSDNLL